MLTFNSFGLSLVLGGFMVLSSCSSEPKSAVAQPSSAANMESFATSKARISFKIKGTGSKGISVK
ncbi:MAG: hypothetical protein ACKO5L_07530, partial [Bacteroidota bacterium]